MSIELNSLVTSTPQIRHGRLCVAGTTTTVHRVVVWYKMGESAETIARDYPHLPIAGIYAALAYYHANQAEIETEIAAEQAEEDRLEAEWYARRELKQERVA
ncbi:MAG: DUF433 domain-containing protein [Pyrinomonadaceae bacterium MAG19_C2-C3]|nr:DUF433 domain-containing protein [Pyrinomonadaceae bacterium MAG19_C2-C3]